jgi:hypothetical protein
VTTVRLSFLTIHEGQPGYKRTESGIMPAQ